MQKSHSQPEMKIVLEEEAKKMLTIQIRYFMLEFFSERLLSPVRLSSVCRLSVTLVRATQAVEILGNISTAFGTLAIR